MRAIDFSLAGSLHADWYPLRGSINGYHFDALDLLEGAEATKIVVCRAFNHPGQAGKPLTGDNTSRLLRPKSLTNEAFWLYFGQLERSADIYGLVSMFLNLVARPVFHK
ncbi:MAG: hypothetical protein O2805_04435 [Proteobacteria bacterium]|nr:hypothetical protein [Pseudomonadota bacterium]